MISKVFLKRVLSAALILLLSLSLFACKQEEKPVVETTVPPTTTAPVLPEIGVLSYIFDENTLEAYKGFIEALEDNGYVDEENIKIVSVECESEERLKKAAEVFVNVDVKLIFAIGTDAAKAAKNATTEIPVVFSCVEDPIGDGLLESCEKPEGNITGVCDYTPVFEQIDLLTTLYPDTERIACVYNGADEDAIFSANLASGEAQTQEVTFTMYPCLTEDEYKDKISDALKKCDALYMVDDALTKACLSSTLKSANKKDIPVFAETVELVQSGCLATAIVNYTDIGYTAGELGVILFRSIKPVSEVPVEYASDCNPVINSDVMKDMKLALPEDIEADSVIIKVVG